MQIPRIIIGTALAALVATSALVAQSENNRLTLPGLTGGELREADLERGDYIVVVWAGWSPRCRDIVERVNRLEQRWRERARVVTVNFDEERPAIESFLRGKQLRVPVYLDRGGEFARKHRVTTLPGLLVYSDGELVYNGRLPDDPEQVLSEALP